MADDARVMRLWRENGLPEYFLGNGGTNDKLVTLESRIRAEALEEAAQRCELLARNLGHRASTADAVAETLAEIIRGLKDKRDD